MPEVERLSYTVTPGPEVLAKMGTSWTLFTMPPVLFVCGPDGEPPVPSIVSLTEAQAQDLTGSGYVVELSDVPDDVRRVEEERLEPVDDVRVSPGLEGVEPEPVAGRTELGDWPRGAEETEPALVTYTAGPGEGEERTEVVAPMPGVVGPVIPTPGVAEVEPRRGRK